MKRIILLFLIAIFFIPASFASDNYIAYADKSSAKTSAKQSQALEKEVKYTLRKLIFYTNTYKKENLEALYADNYINADGFDKKIYFELVQKTWNLYPDIKYTMDIKDIKIIGNTAIAYVDEYAYASTTENVEETSIKGKLKSFSECIYYLEKVGDNWLITSDNIVDEKTSLTYGEANNLDVELIVPQLVNNNKEYTASLKIKVPDKNMFVIASIGQEQITYPQVNSEEVFRKLPESGILERVFRANKNNFNEYTVASLGITRANVIEKNNKKEIKLVITGLGYILTRTNVIPQKDFSKVKKNEQKETTAKTLD